MEITRFPRLHSAENATVQQDSSPSAIVRVQSLHGCRKDHAYYAWATVLKAYTGHDHLSFFTDNAAVVSVDSSQWSFVESDERGRFAAVNDNGYTALCFECRATKSSWELDMRLDLEQCTATLFSKGRVPVEHIDQILKHFEIALEWVRDHGAGTVPLSKLGALESSMANVAPQSLPGPSLMHKLVPETSSQPAVEFSRSKDDIEMLSYTSLHELSQGLAYVITSALEHQRFSKQPVIAMMIPQSLDLYITQLAVLKTGCAFCSISLDTPPERLSFILADIAAPLLLTVSNVKIASHVEQTRVLLVDQVEVPALAEKSCPIVFEVETTQIAYVMYTSGSTGLPKGVPVSHRAATQSILAHDRHIPGFSRFLQFAAPTFDVSLFEIFFTFFRGATIVGCERRALLDDLVGFMNRHHVDAAELTPTVASSLLQRRNVVPELKLLLTIGEMLTRPVVAEFGGSDGQSSVLWAMYGPTEAAIHCTLMPALVSTSHVGNIGYPLDTVSAFIVSSSGSNLQDNIEVLPVGFVGELVIGGHQLAEGYLNRDEQTKSSFIDDARFGVVYRTGDRARQLPDGSFECLGRISSGQVKLRGQRIELGEIEHTALRVPGCSAAVVSVISNCLVLFCCVDDSVQTSDMHNAACQWLPDYMRPAEIILLAHFPHLSSGKIDRKAIERDYSRHREHIKGDNPLKGNEHMKEVLHVISLVTKQEVTPGSSLTNLGIDSLIAISVASKLRSRKLSIATLDIIKSETVYDVARLCGSQRLSQLRTISRGPTQQELRTALEDHRSLNGRWYDVDAIRICTPIQIGLLVEHFKHPGSYWSRFELALPSSTDLQIVEEGLIEILSRNEILRSSFIYAPTTQHQFLQIVWQSDRFPKSLINRRDHNDYESNDEDLLNPCSFRLDVLNGKVQLVALLHHAIYDGWSLDLLAQDLSSWIYHRSLIERPQYAVVQDFYANVNTQEAKSYWRDHLTSCVPTTLDRVNNPLVSNNSAVYNTRSDVFDTLDIALSKIRALAAQSGITPQCYFQAAVMCIIVQYTKEADTILATVTSGRTVPLDNIERIIGPCMSTLPLRLNVSHSLTVRDLLKSIHSRNRSIAEHCTLSLREIRQIAQMASGVALSDILFIWQETAMQIHAPTESAISISSKADINEFGLTVEIEPCGDEVGVRISGDPSIMPAYNSMWMLHEIGKLVKIFLFQPDLTVEQLPMGAQWTDILQQSATCPSQVALDANEGLGEKQECTQTEQSIKDCVARTMQISEAQINIRKPLSHLGLDSLSAIALSRSIREEGYTAVSVSMILQHQNISALAKELETTAIRAKNMDAKPVFHFLSADQLRGIRDRLSKLMIDTAAIRPCTPLQEAMLAVPSHSSEAYYNSLTFNIKLPKQKFIRAWISVVSRHDIFRTIFLPSGNNSYPFVQVVLSDMLEIKIIENSAATRSARDIIQLLQTQYQPLHQSYVYSSGSDTVLHFVCHHAIFDATGMQQLFLEVEAVCKDLPLPSVIGAKPFLSMSLAQRSTDAVRFWCRQFDSFVPKLLETSVDGTQQTCSHTMRVSLDSLKVIVQQSHVSNLAIFQIITAKILSQVFATHDICFGNVVSGRTLPVDGLDRLVFPTFNTVPVRVDLSKCGDNISSMQQLYRSSIDALPFQLAPLRAIQNHLGYSKFGLFSVLLLVQHESHVFDQSIWDLVSDIGTMTATMTFEIITNRSEDTIQLNLHFDSTIISACEASQLCQLFDDFLYKSLTYPNAPAIEPVLNASTTLHDFTSRLYQPEVTLANISQQQDTHHKPLGEAEQHLIDILSSFTGYSTSQIKSSDTIHHLGIDSVGSIQLASILSRDMEATISSVDILERPDIGDLAYWLKTEAKQLNPRSTVDFSRFEAEVKAQVLVSLNASAKDSDLCIQNIRPCTPLQCGLISQSLQSPGLYLNSMTYTLNLIKPLHDMADLMKLWVQSNPILRSAIVAIDHPFSSFAMFTYDHTPTQLFQIVEGQYQYRTIDFDDMPVISSDPAWRAFVTVNERTCTLQLIISHALFDAHSLQLLLRDLENMVHHTRHTNVNLVNVYDSVVSQILRKSCVITDDQEMDDHAEFWKSLFLDMSPMPFPCLCPLREAAESAVGERTLSQSIQDLEAKLSKQGATVQAAAQATWACILSAYAGEEIISFGVVLSGRDALHDSANVAFPCMTTVPCVARVTLNRDALLRDMMKYNSQVRKHQFCQAKHISQWVGMSHHALFDTILVVQRPYGSSNAKGWLLKEEDASDEFAVSVELVLPDAGPMRLRITFDQSKIPAEQAYLILEQFEHTLYEYAATNNESDKEQWNILSRYPAREIQLSSPVSLLHEFVELNAISSPWKKALEFVIKIDGTSIQSKTWNYEQLNLESDRIAALLQSLLVQPRSIVAICFDKCAEASFSIIGILKAGCAFVALDPKAPIARKEYIIQDSRAHIILTSAALFPELHALEGSVNLQHVQVLSVDANLKLTNQFQPVVISAIDLCYCLYTSGTTGKPKGCMITHENAVQAMRAFSLNFKDRWTSESKWLQFASFHFDVSVLEQFWPWSEGLSVISAPRDLMLEDLPAFIRTLSITHLDLTPSLATLLEPDEVPSLHHGVFITGGESLRQDILDKWGSKKAIFNAYGPTECTIGVTMFLGVPENGRPSNIGKLFANVGCYVLEPGTERIVLRGAIGELCISGKLVGKGYLNNQKLTGEKFPILSRFGERVYRTGDLVRLLHDGSFQFLGRFDDQVKLRGQRLEIGEINTVIRTSGHVKQVATFVCKHPKQVKEHLVSFLVSIHASPSSQTKLHIVDEYPATMKAIVEHCQQHLPPYMIPTYLIAINHMPLTPNNKTDFSSLRQFFVDQASAHIQQIAPYANSLRTNLNNDEGRIATILTNFFNIDRQCVLPGSNIFELGLDSISSIHLARRLKQDGFSNATPRSVLQAPTIAAMAKTMRGSGSRESDAESAQSFRVNVENMTLHHLHAVSKYLAIDPATISAIIPCTPLQEAMVTESLLNHSDAYFLAFHFTLSKDIDIERLKAAWNFVYKTLDILRTSFVLSEDGPLQIVIQDVELYWNEVAPSAESVVSAMAREREQWLNCNRKHISQPIRLALFQTDENVYLNLMLFHGVYDGDSLQILLDYALVAYNEGRISLKGPQFAEVLPYGPLRPYSGGEFWKKHIVADLGYVSNNSSTAERGEAATSYKQTINVPQLETVRRRLNVTQQALIQACWSAALAEFCKGYPVLGLVLSGRSLDLEGVEQVIGPLFNTVLFQPQFCDADTWAQLAKSCHTMNLSALPYRHDPLRQVLKTIGKQASVVPDSLFIFEIGGNEAIRAQDNDVWSLAESEPVALRPLTFQGIFQDERLDVTLVAQTSCLDLAALRHLMDRFFDCLRAALEQPERSVLYTITVAVAATSVPQLKDSQKQQNGVVEYEWSREAQILRQELAVLAQQDTESISPYQSIFEIGLDSIDVVILSSRLGKRQLSLSMSTIMKYPTIHEMSKQMTGTEEVHAQSSDSLLRDIASQLSQVLQGDKADTDAFDRILPATPLQEAMLSRMMATEFEEYYNHDILKLMPSTNIARLEQAWMIAIDKFEILRTGFVEINDPNVNVTYAQVVYSTAWIKPWRSVQVDNLDVRNVLSSITNRGMSIEACKPLLQLTLIETPQHKYLVLSLPHALYDGWSIQLLHNDIKRLYNDLAIDSVSNDFVLAKIFGQESAHEAEKFWQTQLEQCQLTCISEAKDGNIKQKHAVQRCEFESRSSVGMLRAFCKAQSITVHSLTQTCWSLMLSAMSGAHDVVFGLVLSGRDSEQAQRAQFPTMNTVAFRTTVHGTIEEMLKATQSNLADVRRYQHYPLRDAQKAAGFQEEIFNTLFLHQARPEFHGEPLPDLYQSIYGASDVQYPLCVESEINKETMVWRGAAKAIFMDKRDLADLLQGLDSMLDHIMHHTESDANVLIDEKLQVAHLASFRSVSCATSSSETLVTEGHQSLKDLTPTERVVRLALSQISNLPEDDITPTASIYHYGLDSISAIKLCNNLKRQGLSIKLGDVLRDPTVCGMARAAQAKQSLQLTSLDWVDTTARQRRNTSSYDQIASQLGVEAAAIESVAPATAGQMYFMGVWNASWGNLFYSQFTYNIHGRIVQQEIAASWMKVVEANQILRTVFVTDQKISKTVLQVVLQQAETTISSHAGRKAHIQPLHSIELEQLADDEWKLLVNIHHALYDGVSLDVLISQLQHQLNISDHASHKEPPRAQAAIGTMEPAEDLDAERFWTSYLACTGDVQAASRKYDANAIRSRTEIFRRSHVADASHVTRYARQIGVSAAALLLTVFATTRQRMISEDGSNVVIGVYISNRGNTDTDTQHTTHPTVNIVPLKISTSGGQAAVDSIAKQVQADLNHIQQSPFCESTLWQIRQWTGVVLDTIVNIVHLPDQELQSEANHNIVIREYKTDMAPTDGRTNTFNIEEPFVLPRGLDLSEHEESYRITTDLEMAIRNGALDVGLFAPSNVMSFDQGKEFLSDFKEALEAINNNLKE